MKQVTRFEAFDGEIFATEAECRSHEYANAHRRLVGLTLDQVNAAMARTDSELADAFEAVGTKIARDRRDAGELKRPRRAETQEPAPMESAPPTSAEPAPPMPYYTPPTMPIDECAVEGVE